MTDKKTINSLKKMLVEVFPKDKPPNIDEIIDHQCLECFGVRDTFGGFEWWKIEGNTIDVNFVKSSLFTPKAFHYYIPAYILRALDKFGKYEEVLEFLLYNFYPSDLEGSEEYFVKRQELFSKQQKLFIVLLLNTVIEDEDLEISHDDARKALSYWKHYETC